MKEELGAMVSGGTPVRSSVRWAWLDWALLAAVLLVALGVRFSHASRPLVYDELWHLGLSTGRGSPIGQIEPDRLYLDPPKQTSLAGAPPFYQVWTHMDGVLHPPLYVVTLRLWRDVFGESDLTAKSYSIAWSLVALGFVFATIRLATDRYAAGLATLAMAIAQTQNYFAEAVRGYEMLLAIGSIAVWLMVRIELLDSTRRRAITLALITLPLMLTHYFAFGAAAAIGVYGLWRCVGHRIAFIASMIASAAIYAIVWLPFALRQLDDVPSGDIFLKTATFNAFHEAVIILAVPLRLIIDTPAVIYVSGAVGAVLIGAAIFDCARAIRRREVHAVVPLTVWLLATIGFLGALDVARSTKHGLFIRYFAVASPAVFAIVPVIGRSIRRRMDLVLSAGLVLAALVIPGPPGQVLNDSPDWSMIARSLARVASADEAILIYGANIVLDYNDGVFIHLSHEPGFFPRPIVKVEKPLSPELRAQLPRRAWLIVPGVDPDQLARTFPNVRVLQTVDVPQQAMLIHLDLRPEEGK